MAKGFINKIVAKEKMSWRTAKESQDGLED